VNKLIIPLAVVIAILAVLALFQLQRQTPEPEVPPLPADSSGQPPVVTPQETPIRFPLPEVPSQDEPPAQEPDEEQAAAEDTPEPSEEIAIAEEEIVTPLPPLDDSDVPFKEALGAFVTERSLEALFRTDGFIRRLVVTIDNLPHTHLPRSKHRVTRATSGRFAVDAEGESLYLSADNFARYTPVVELIAALDVDRLISVYLRYYPLFQEAYEYLGYPSAYFNDRLIDVIDHLLAAPVVDGPVRLVRPHVLYRYADPDLETLSAGRKVLVRAGAANANRVKAKLREVRQALTGRAEAEELSKEIETGIDLLLRENAEESAP
jgi:hypothetical protein